MKGVVIVSCPCGKRFPLNTWKHPDRKTVNCPHCGREHPNIFSDKNWKPNEQWHKGKHRSRAFTVTDMKRFMFGSPSIPPITIKPIEAVETDVEAGETKEAQA